VPGAPAFGRPRAFAGLWRYGTIAAVLAILAVTATFGQYDRADKTKAIVRRFFTDILSQESTKWRLRSAPKIP